MPVNPNPTPASLADYPGFDRLIGLQITEAGPDRVVASLEVTPDHHQPFGVLHGGVLATMVETVASVGSAHWFGDRGTIVGVANSTDFYRATREGTVTAVGTPLHQGRSSQVWLVEITDEQGRRVARGQLRVANLERRDPAGA